MKNVRSSISALGGSKGYRLSPHQLFSPFSPLLGEAEGDQDPLRGDINTVRSDEDY